MIVTTTHFSTRICAERSRRAEAAGAAMVMVMPPYHGATIRAGEAGIDEFFRTLSDAVAIPIMIQDAPVSGVALSADLLARLAREVANVAYFKIEVPGAAAKLRELIRLGGDAVEGPWDGEEAITLMADLDAGATGTMPGGGYPDLLRPIVEAHAAGRREEAAERLRARPAADQLREPAVRASRLQGADAGGRRDRLATTCGTRSRRCIRRPAPGSSRSRGGSTRWCCAGPVERRQAHSESGSRAGSRRKARRSTFTMSGAMRLNSVIANSTTTIGRVKNSSQF